MNQPEVKHNSPSPQSEGYVVAIKRECRGKLPADFNLEDSLTKMEGVKIERVRREANEAAGPVIHITGDIQAIDSVHQQIGDFCHIEPNIYCHLIKSDPASATLPKLPSEHI